MSVARVFVAGEVMHRPLRSTIRLVPVPVREPGQIAPHQMSQSLHGHREEMPVAELVELPCRGDGLGSGRTRQPLTARLPEAAERPEKRHVLGYETAFVIAADCLEVFLATEHHTRIHSGHED